MTRVITFLLLFVTTQLVVAQQETEKQAIKKSIDVFFQALYKGDSTMMKKAIHKEFSSQTTFSTPQGEKRLVSQTKKNLLDGVAKKKPEDTYEERLLSYDIKIDGNLASVWTPYEFYVNGNFSHCGANSFQLFNNNGKWEIIYIVDMRRRGSCEAMKDKK